MKRQTTADIIRNEARVIRRNHSNKWWQKYLMEKYSRNVSIQFIAAVLGRYRDRIIADNKELHEFARRFILACANDIELAKRILMEYKP